MKKLDIAKIDKFNKFITKKGLEAKLISYLPEALPKNRLIFMVQKNIIHTDESGVCHSVNGYDANYAETNFGGFDVYVDDIQYGWINLYDTKTSGEIIAECSSKIYSSYENARKNSEDNVLQTIKIEWVIEDERENS